MATVEQLQAAIARAQAANDEPAVRDLQKRLQNAQGQGPTGVGATPPGPSGLRGQETFQRAGGYGPVLAGVADAGIKGYLGLKQFFGGLDDEERGVLQQQKLEEEADPEGGWRTAGQVGANIAATAIPGAKAGKLLTAARAPFLSGVGAAGVVGGATEGLLTPGEGDTYGEQMASKGGNALKATLAAMAGQTVLGGAGKAVSGMFKAKPEAEALFKQGINPTLQQGAEGKAGRWIGGLTSGATDVRRRQEREVADALMNRVTEGNVSAADDIGRGYYQSAKKYIGDEYDQLLDKKRFPISPTTRTAVSQAATDINATGQFQVEAGKAGAAIANIMGDAQRNINVGHTKLRDQYLTPMARTAYAEQNEEIRRRILAARDTLIQRSRQTRLTADEQTRLRELDSLNFDLQRVREAVAGAAGEKEGISLLKLASAYGKKSDAATKVGNTTEAELVGPATRVLGSTPRQDEARTGYVVARRIGAPLLMGGAAVASGNPLLTVPLAGAYGVSALGQSAKGSKFLLGQNDWQREMAEYLRNLPGLTGIGASGLVEE